MQAWQHPTLRLLYSERLVGAELLAIIMPPMPSLFVLQFISSAVNYNLLLGIEIQNMNGCVGHNKRLV